MECLLCDYLNEIIVLFERDCHDEAIDLLYDHVDEMIIECQFQEVDRLLDIAMTQNNLPMAVLLSLLTVTLPWKNMFMRRKALVDIARDRIINEGNVKRLHAILGGLE